MLLLALYLLSIFVRRLYDVSLGMVMTPIGSIMCFCVFCLCVFTVVGIKNYAGVGATVIGCTIVGMIHTLKVLIKGIKFVCIKLLNFFYRLRNRCYLALKIYGFNEAICSWLSLLIVIITYLVLI